MACPSDRAAVAQRRAVPDRPGSVQRGLYSVYRGDDRLGADVADGPCVLTIIGCLRKAQPLDVGGAAGGAFKRAFAVPPARYRRQSRNRATAPGTPRLQA